MATQSKKDNNEPSRLSITLDPYVQKILEALAQNNPVFGRTKAEVASYIIRTSIQSMMDEEKFEKYGVDLKKIK